MQTLAIDADPNYNSLLISNKLIFAGEISVELFTSGLHNINIQLSLEQLNNHEKEQRSRNPHTEH